ncbi:hypothetical protein D0865_15916, partial [Hortaea werneckii]
RPTFEDKLNNRFDYAYRIFSLIIETLKESLTTRTTSSKLFFKQRQISRYSSYLTSYVEDVYLLALLTIYYRGLKDNVKDKLIRSSIAQDILERIIQVAIEIDNKLRKEKAYAELREKGSSKGIKREGPEYYNYYKIGHYVRDYYGRKLNIMLVKEPIDELNDRRGAYDVSKLIKELKTEPNYKAIH